MYAARLGKLKTELILKNNNTETEESGRPLHHNNKLCGVWAVY